LHAELVIMVANAQRMNWREMEKAWKHVQQSQLYSVSLTSHQAAAPTITTSRGAMQPEVGVASN